MPCLLLVLSCLVCLSWCPRGSVGMAALLYRWQTAGGGSIPRWSASKPLAAGAGVPHWKIERIAVVEQRSHSPAIQLTCDLTSGHVRASWHSTGIVSDHTRVYSFRNQQVRDYVCVVRNSQGWYVSDRMDLGYPLFAQQQTNLSWRSPSAFMTVGWAIQTVSLSDCQCQSIQSAAGNSCLCPKDLALSAYFYSAHEHPGVNLWLCDGRISLTLRLCMGGVVHNGCNVLKYRDRDSKINFGYLVQIHQIRILSGIQFFDARKRTPQEIIHLATFLSLAHECAQLIPLLLRHVGTQDWVIGVIWHLRIPFLPISICRRVCRPVLWFWSHGVTSEPNSQLWTVSTLTQTHTCSEISYQITDVECIVHAKTLSNKMPDSGAMTDGSKRRHEAVQSASDSEDASSVIGSYSFISDTGDSPPWFL